MTWVDDTVLLARSAAAAQYLFTTFVGYLKVFGLTPELAKTEVLYADHMVAVPLTLMSKVVAPVDQVVLLRVAIDRKACVHTHIQYRLHKSYASLFSHVSRSRMKLLSTHVVINILAQTAFQSLMWGTYSFPLQLANIKHIQVLMTSIFRLCTNIQKWRGDFVAWKHDTAHMLANYIAKRPSLAPASIVRRAWRNLARYHLSDRGSFALSILRWRDADYYSVHPKRRTPRTHQGRRPILLHEAMHKQWISTHLDALQIWPTCGSIG